MVYRRYAGLYFIFCVDATDNELLYLETIHLFVEVSRIGVANWLAAPTNRLALRPLLVQLRGCCCCCMREVSRLCPLLMQRRGCCCMCSPPACCEVLERSRLLCVQPLLLSRLALPSPDPGPLLWQCV